MNRSLLAWLLLVALAPLAAVAQPATTAPAKSDLPVTIGAEVAVVADGPGKDCRGTPAVAFGGGAYLVVWREGWEGKNGGARIRAVRVGLDGKLLDVQPIELAANKDKDAPQERPRVAFCPSTGSGQSKGTFLVVWQDLRNGTDYDVLAARVSADGKLLDAEPIKVATGPHNQALPDVAADNDGFLVVWQGFVEVDRAFHGYAARVDGQGKVRPPVETGITPQPKIAWDGTSFLVACGGKPSYPAASDVVRVGPEGQPVGKKFAAMGSAGLISLSAVPGRGWLLVTHRNTPNAWGWGGPGAMRCCFILADGNLDPSLPKENAYPGYDKLEPNWLDYTTKDRGNWPWGPSASAWDGKQSVVVWQRFHCVGEKKSMLANGDIMLSRTDGWKRQGDVPVAVAASDAEELDPALASDGAGNLLCVYEKEVGTRTIICARTVASK